MGLNPTADRIDAALNADMRAAIFGREQPESDTDGLGRENPC